MKREAEVVIIGGGIMGSSVAYNLAKAGKEVVVLEQNEICSGTSSSTAAWLWPSDKVPDHYGRMAWRSMEIYKNLEEELGTEVEYAITGSLELLRTEEQIKSALKTVETHKKLGHELKILSSKEAIDMEPVIDKNILGAIYCKEDGHINPFLLVNAYIQAAKKLGAEVNTYTKVESFIVQGNNIKEIVTNKGNIKPGLVICAAGIYSKEIGEMLDINIPIHPERGYCLVSEKLPKILNTTICGARQTDSGNIIFGFIQDEVDSIDRRMYLKGMEWAANDILNLLPGFGDINIIRSYTGIRVKPDDKFPIIGPTHKIDNFWLAITHSAFVFNCSLSEVIVELVNGERDIESLPYYKYARFL